MGGWFNGLNGVDDDIDLRVDFGGNTIKWNRSQMLIAILGQEPVDIYIQKRRADVLFQML